MKALLVEPDEARHPALGELLLEGDWHGERVSSLEAAAAVFVERPASLVVIAAHEDAPALVRKIRALPSGGDALVLIAHSGPVPHGLVEAGADDLLDCRGSREELALRLGFARSRLARRVRAHADELVLVFQQALRESEVRYRALFDQSPVGVFLCDRDLRINDVNERLRQITGIPRSRMVGMSLRDREHPPVPGLETAAADGTASYDGPYDHPDGSQRWLTVRYAPLRDPDAVVVGGIGVVEDVSERHRAEYRLHQQTAALEDALQARTRLYTSMNHELRTPISAIMLYQELLLAGALGSLTAEQQQAVERSHTATRHLLELVSDILDLSKLEAGRIVLHPGEVRLEELLHDLLGTMLPLTEKHGSRLVLELDPRLTPIITDPQRVRQILLNLVSNAAKFGRGRPITIRCRPWDAEGVAIDVADEGIGIAPHDLQRIFDDFVQVGSPPETGTGLGLSISRRLATLLDGLLEVESTPGVGSTFRLTLPPALRNGALAPIEAPN